MFLHLFKFVSKNLPHIMLLHSYTTLFNIYIAHCFAKAFVATIHNKNIFREIVLGANKLCKAIMHAQNIP